VDVDESTDKLVFRQVKESIPAEKIDQVQAEKT
jgi:hypothetical protein